MPLGGLKKVEKLLTKRNFYGIWLKNSGIVATSLIIFSFLWTSPIPQRLVSSYFEIKEEDLRSPIKKRSVTQAKSVFGYLSIKRMGYSGREVGKFMNIRGYSAIRRAEVGQIIVDKAPRLWDLA